MNEQNAVVFLVSFILLNISLFFMFIFNDRLRKESKIRSFKELIAVDFLMSSGLLVFFLIVMIIIDLIFGTNYVVLK